MSKIGFVLVALLLAIMPCTSVYAQEAVIPELNITPKALPDTEGIRFVKELKLGWNLGNTFDAYIDNPWFSDELDYESAWNGVKTTDALLKALKDAGFGTIRVPVSWHDHVSGSEFTISERWLARVKEVVTAAIDQDLHVILNIHHDDRVGFYYPSTEQLEQSTTYVKSIWTQLAAAFGEFDNRLIFECINEPRLVKTKYEWYLDSNSAECKDAVECINKLNQVFVDTVRSTGGNNATRFLMVPGYSASLEGAMNSGFRLPTDSATDRLIVSVHGYTPYSFALQSPEEGSSTDVFSIENKMGISDIARMMKSLYEKFVAQGIPVLMGEFGSRDKGGNDQARVEHAAYYIASARANGISCCWWDNNLFTGSGERFGLLDRATLQWKAPKILEAMLKYAE